MLSREDNELLTRVGPGTSCGELLRRYWMPVCPAAEVTAEKPKRRLRILGEDLVLFRDGAGRYGLLPEHCPHRHASLYFGFVEADGLRCAYHGWKFDTAGHCIEQPFEPANSPLKGEACRRAYRVEALAGLLFAYLGPDPAPLLPRWETLVRKDGTRRINVMPLHRCNWLQAQENSEDPVHTYYLHSHMARVLGKKSGEAAYYYRPIENYDFELCRAPAWTGIRKIRVYGGDNPEREIGHPAIFPNILMNPQGKEIATHWRVPVDDTHTYIIRCHFTPSDDGREVAQSEADIPVNYAPDGLRPDGERNLSTFPEQDQMAWETQGPIFDRTTELLGRSDRGIVMFRNLLRREIEAVRAGSDPAGVIRDPAINGVISFTLSTGQARAARAFEAAE